MAVVSIKNENFIKIFLFLVAANYVEQRIGIFVHCHPRQCPYTK